MSIVRSTDPDFRICRVSFDGLLEIQIEAEEGGWATRWSSEQALRGQVKEESAILQTLKREERSGVLRAYRCLLLFSAVGEGGAGGITTIDIRPSRLESLERLDRDPGVRSALARMFSLALGGITTVAKT
ncbi:MAG: hypothetical protein JWN52_7683 [Actinomycetia bacterium]|nr:hypothetical protein [Actinomycetes bacterium]